MIVTPADSSAATPVSVRAQVPHKPKLSFEEVNSRALSALPHILARWLPGGKRRGNEYVARNPKRTDKSLGSFSINLRTGRWSDFATEDAGGDVTSLCAYLFDLRQGEALEVIARMVGLS